MHLFLHLVLGFLFSRISTAQQFPLISNPVDFPNVSASCSAALNSTIQCSDFLLLATTSKSQYLDVTHLTDLCVDSCRQSLGSYDAALRSSCSETETIRDGDLEYPARERARSFLYLFQSLCRKDASSSAFCGTLFLSWENKTQLTQDELCSDCALGTQQIDLNSPFGYQPDLASDFSKATSSCGKSNYPFIVPSKTYGASIPSTTDAPSSTPCSIKYTLQQDDTCNSVALKQSVSTFSLLVSNNLQAYCKNFPVSGTEICIPSKCAVYTIKADDTCANIVSSSAGQITLTQLKSWNPNINEPCSNLGQLADTQICISPPGGFVIPQPPSTTVAPTPVPTPSNIANGTKSYCGGYHLVVEGDKCGDIAKKYAISLTDFYFLNPEIDANCYNLLLDKSYCVKPVGTITTYPAYGAPSGDVCLAQNAPSSCFIPTSSFSTVPFWPDGVEPIWVSGTVSYPTLAPTASGTPRDCREFIEYTKVSTYPGMNQTVLDSIKVMEANLNKCGVAALNNEVDLPNFLDWNPMLKAKPADSCSLDQGVRYCLKTIPKPTSTITLSQPPPAAIQILPGTASNCDRYAWIWSGDAEWMECNDFLSQRKLTQADLYAMNTWVKQDCSGLFANLAKGDQRPVCIHVNGAISTAPSTTTSGALSTPTGTAPDCQQYHLAVTGDTCAAIDTKYGITFAQLYSWNPALGNDCQFLVPGLSYCVKPPSGSITSTPTSPKSSSTTTKPAISTPTGTVPDCQQYHLAVSGDSCGAIDTKYGITFAQLYLWNPALGDNCQFLVPGLSYCVKSPTKPPADGPPGPTSPGVTPNCSKWILVQKGGSCAQVQKDAAITFAQLYSWNPAIGSDCRYLQVGVAYCVGVKSQKA